MCGSPSDRCDLWEVKNYLILRATRIPLSQFSTTAFIAAISSLGMEL